MTDLDLLLAVAGAAVTLMVVAGMVLITPRGQVETRSEADGERIADSADATATPGRAQRRSPRPDPAIASLHPQEAALDQSVRR